MEKEEKSMCGCGEHHAQEDKENGCCVDHCAHEEENGHHESLHGCGCGCHCHETPAGHSAHNHGESQGHCHCHHGSGRGKVLQIVLSALLLVGAVVVEKNCALSVWQLLLIYMVPYLLAGYATLKEAAEGIARGDLFNENFLMAIATVGALCIGFFPGADTEFPEAVFVMLFFQIGELFEGYAEGKSRDSISHLMNIRPDVAHVERAGTVEDISPENVSVGSIVIVKPGEKVPLDGVVIEGTSSLNTVALTGESLPRDIGVGDEAASGCVNLSGLLRLKITKAFGESTVSKIIRLVEHANESKSRSESFITRFARVYTPIVVVAALLLAFVPPLFVSGGYWSAFPLWLHRALIFLVVSCPCALVISVPLTFFGGLGGASRRGILVKGSRYMDALANIGTMAFDKTGTLTQGVFAVEAVHPETLEEKELLHLAAHVEHFSTHPIAEALRTAFPQEATDGCAMTDVEELAGYGIRACVNGHLVCVGNTKMMDKVGAKWHNCHRVGTIIHVAVDGCYAGHIVISDCLKDDSVVAVAALKRLGIGRLVMLTGDRREVAHDVADKLALDGYHAELLPADKVACVDQLLAEKPSGKSVAFVGDGINDAPVLKLADVGIAMGGLGSDAAIEAADVVLMDDKPTKIATAVRIARRTIGIARQNVAFAIGVKVAILLLATVGLGTMWMAVFADVGVTVLAVFNAMRALKG